MWHPGHTSCGAECARLVWGSRRRESLNASQPVAQATQVGSQVKLMVPQISNDSPRQEPRGLDH